MAEPVDDVTPLDAVRDDTPPVAAWNDGSAPAPFDVRTCPAVPTLAIDCKAAVLVVPPQMALRPLRPRLLLELTLPA